MASGRATPPLLKSLNERTVLDAIRSFAPVSRAEISRRVGIVSMVRSPMHPGPNDQLRSRPVRHRPRPVCDGSVTAAQLKALLRRRIAGTQRSMRSHAPWIALALSLLFATFYMCCEEPAFGVSKGLRGGYG